MSFSKVFNKVLYCFYLLLRKGIDWNSSTITVHTGCETLPIVQRSDTNVSVLGDVVHEKECALTHFDSMNAVRRYRAK